MFKNLKWIIHTRPFGLFTYYFLMLYLITLRIKVVNQHHLHNLLDKNETVLLCGWHQQFFSAIRTFRRFNKYNPAVMISRSRDGEFISRIAHRVGWRTVRGSSSRGGRQAMSAMISHLATHKLAAHILDGPRGPIGKVKPGAIKMAHISGAFIVPFYVVADNAWYFNSWDKFMLPKPFSKVSICYDEPLKFAPSESPEEFEEQRQLLENKMKRRLVLTGNT